MIRFISGWFGLVDGVVGDTRPIKDEWYPANV